MAYTYYRSLTCDHTQVPSDQANFAVVVVGTIAELATVANGGHVENASGFDVVFATDNAGSSLLDWEVVSWDATTGVVEYWVKIPTLSSSVDTVIYLVYGNSSISTDQSDPTATWDSDFVAVYHMGAQASLSVADSTGVNNGTNHGAGVTTGVFGAPSGAATFASSSSEYIDLGNDSSIEITGPITIEAWLKSTGAGATFQLVVSNLDAAGTNGYLFTFHLNVDTYFQLLNAGTTQTANGRGVTQTSWMHVVGTYDGTTISFYTDGTLDSASSTGLGVSASSANVNIGRWPGGATDYVDGDVDEVRISKTGRSADYVKTSYNMQNSPSGFTTVGSEQLVPTGPQTVTPSGIASGLMFGTPSLGTGNIQPGGIPSALAFGVPLVAPGCILLSGIPSGVAFGTPFINAQQIITPALTLSPVTTGGIPSGLAFGTPRTAHVTVIEPALTLSPLTMGGIASGFAAGTPLLKASGQFLNLGGIVTGFAAGTPILVGGVGVPVLYIAGVNVNKYWGPGGNGTNAAASTITSQTIGRATLTLDMTVLDGSGYVPVVGQTIRVQENGVTIFGGCIDTVAQDWENSGVSPQVVVFRITALDKASICDRRIVTQAAGNPYKAGSDIVGVILDICTLYLNGEGITTQDLPATGTLGTLTSDLPLNYTTVTAAFNQIATLSGTIWWIDFFSALHFSAFSDLPPAPFSLSATSGQFRNAVGYTSLSGNGVTNGYRNVQYVVTNLNVLPGAGTGGTGGTGGLSGVTESYTWTTGLPGVITFPNGTMLLETKLPIGSVVSMRVNGFDQTVESALVSFGTFTTGPPDYGWVFLPGNNTLNPFLVPVPVGAAITITYVPGNTTNATAATVGTALVPTAATGATFGTCGSGTFEAVAQVQDISSQSDLDAIAQAELAKSGGIPRYLTFQTDKPGLAVGQLLVVNLPAVGLVGYMGASMSLLVTSVSARAEAQPLQYGSLFRWDVTAISNHDPGNWVTYFSRLIGMAGNPQPVLQYEVATFILAPSGSLSSGTVSTNPTYADRTGLMVEIYGGAGLPPQDQNLILTVTDFTRGYVLGSITIPAGSSAQVTTTIPATSQLYVYSKDQLTVTATYQVTGPNPIAAANVTLKARWAM